MNVYRFLYEAAPVVGAVAVGAGMLGLGIAGDIAKLAEAGELEYLIEAGIAAGSMVMGGAITKHLYDMATCYFFNEENTQA